MLLMVTFPQGEGRAHPTKFPAKEKFYADLLELSATNFSAEDLVLVMGDMNVAPADIDVGIKPENAKRWIKTGKCAFLPEERQWLQNLKDWGLQDSFRAMNRMKSIATAGLTIAVVALSRSPSVVCV